MFIWPGLASDGFSPYGMMSLSHSTWHVIVTLYNLSPSLVMHEMTIHNINFDYPRPKKSRE